MPEEIHIPEPVASMSITDKFIGILSSPGEVFEHVASYPEKQNSNWGVPIVATILMMIIYTFVVFKQPAIQDQMSTIQNKAMQQRVADGKMTQEQMEKAMEFAPKGGSPMFLIFGSLGSVVTAFLMLFIYSGLYWLGGKYIASAQAPFSKVLEVYGLSLYVVVIGTLVSMVTVVAMGSIYAQPSLALAISDFNPMNKVHKLLNAINIIEFWQMFVLGVGLSKIWKASLGKSLGVVVGVWVVWNAIKIFSGMSLGGM